MPKKLRSQKKVDERLNVPKIMGDFQKLEESSGHRKGTFNIEKPFEEALDTILKAKPEPKKPSK
jgi:hypothetical protein